MDKRWRCLLTSVEALLHLSSPAYNERATAYNPFTTFSIPESSHNPKKSDIGFHDHRVYFIIIHKNPTLCVGRVHTSSYCKTMTLTSAGVVLFFNKNNIIAKMQFTCISCNKCLTKYALQISVIGINYL